MNILDIGCGRNKMAGAIGMDQNPQSDADIIHNIDILPWPFEDSSFDYIRALDVLEHIDNFIGVLEEIHRIAKSNAIVEIRMPFMSSCNVATDPTHKRSATSRTFDYFDPTKDLSKYKYSKAQYKLLEFHYLRSYCGNFGVALSWFDRLIVPQIERHALLYELYFAYVYPMHDIEYKLLVQK